MVTQFDTYDECRSFVRSFVIVGRGPAYSKPQRWDHNSGPVHLPRDRKGIGRCVRCVLATCRESELSSSEQLVGYFYTAEAAILKVRKIAISRPRFQLFWRNLAWWCSSTILTVRTVTDLKFKNPRWQRLPSWKKIQNRDVSANGLTDQHEIWQDDKMTHIGLPDRTSSWDFEL